MGKSADAAEIKKAYRKAAIKNPPDKGGDPEKVSESRAHTTHDEARDHTTHPIFSRRKRTRQIAPRDGDIYRLPTKNKKP